MPAPRIATAALAVQLKIQAMAGSVAVYVDGKRALYAKTGARPIRGRWGIGAPPGCRASWKNVLLR